MSGSYPYAGKCATVYKYSTVHGISQGKKHVDDIRQACELKIQVREQKFLVPRVLCRYDNTLDYLRGRFDKESGLAFISKFNALRDKAVQYSDAGVAPESVQGQEFAKEFWQLITEFTDGDMSMLPQLMKMGEINTDNTDWQQKQEKLNAFLGPALETYFNNLGMNPFEVKNG